MTAYEILFHFIGGGLTFQIVALFAPQRLRFLLLCLTFVLLMAVLGAMA